MDLISDFKRYIRFNTVKTTHLLQQTFVDINLEKNKDFYRIINKYYTGISIWIEVLKEKNVDEEKNKLLDNILLSYCSIINNVVLGDVKILNFLLRNIIESVLRYITNDLASQNLESLFISISHYYQYIDNNQLTIKYVSQIKFIYTEVCHFVHTDVNKIPLGLINLMDYEFNKENIELSSEFNRFEKLNIAIINLFNVKYSSSYIQLKSNSKAYLSEIIPLEDRIEFSDFLNDNKIN